MFVVLKSALILTASIVGGGFLTFVWSDYLHHKLRGAAAPDDKEAHEPRILWIPALIGVLERALFTIMIAWGVEASGAFCGGWITAKAISGMGPWNGDTALHRARIGVGFLGSGLSLLIGVVCGLCLRAWLAP